jgi:hypothetical protein
MTFPLLALGFLGAFYTVLGVAIVRRATNRVAGSVSSGMTAALAHNWVTRPRK